MNQRRNSSSSL